MRGGGYVSISLFPTTNSLKTFQSKYNSVYYFNRLGIGSLRVSKQKVTNSSLDSCVCNVQYNPSNKNSAVTIAYDNVYGQNINDYFLDIIDIDPKSETTSGKPYTTSFTKKSSNGKDLNAGSVSNTYNNCGWSKFFWPIFNI